MHVKILQWFQDLVDGAVTAQWQLNVVSSGDHHPKETTYA